MKCRDCDFYKTGYLWNGCGLTGDECFRQDENCTLVNEDGSINYNDAYFKDETGRRNDEK